MSAPAMPFLQAEIRRDANPTPTRFLLECGAFTSVFVHSLDSSFNPFDASYRFLNTGTPKAELDPFDTSSREPPIVSVSSSTYNYNSNLKDKSLESLDMDRSWPDTVFDTEKMTSNSPSFSPSYSSYSSFSASPSPQLPSPPMNPTLFQVSFSPTGAPPESFSNIHYVSENSNVFVPTMTLHRNPTLSHHKSADQVKTIEQTAYESTDHGVDTEDNDPVRFPREPMGQDEVDADCSEEPLAKTPCPSSKKATATKLLKLAKSPDTPRTGSKSRKRKTELLSPEAKRQRFLERNRKAASKCREKKRLQTLQIINDADMITAKNQELHESLVELKEEVRRLKNQILGHRDCSCDVIQKFVQSIDDVWYSSSSSSSLARSSSSSSSSSKSLSESMMEAPSPTAFSFSMSSYIF